MGTQLPYPKRHSPQFPAHVCCGQMAAWIKMSLGMELGLCPGDFVLDGDPAPSPKGAEPHSPTLGPFLLWANGCMNEDDTWYGCMPQPSGLCVRWRPNSPPQKFSAHVYFGQMTGWIKMPLSTKVGLSPGDFMLDGDPATPPQKGGEAPSPIFGPCLLRPNGWMDQDATLVLR